MNRTKRQVEKKRVMALLDCFQDSPDDLVFWAFRYFMGRMTIHTCCFAEELARAWKHLDARIKALIRKELDEAFRKDDAMRADEQCSTSYYPLGMDCDRAAWELVREAYARNHGLAPQGEHHD